MQIGLRKHISYQGGGKYEPDALYFVFWSSHKMNGPIKRLAEPLAGACSGARRICGGGFCGENARRRSAMGHEFQVTAESMREFLATPSAVGLERVAARGEQFARAFVTLARSEFALEHIRLRLKAELELLFAVLERHGAEFGFRSAADMLRFANVHVALGGSPNDCDGPGCLDRFRGGIS